jgi:hypothetical protein
MLFSGRDLGDGTIGEYAIDITDRKRVEAALVRNEKLATLGRLAATISTRSTTRSKRPPTFSTWREASKLCLL